MPKDARLAIAGVRAALSGRAAADHTHTLAEVSGLEGALDAKAPLDSPALTGTPTAPTPDPGDNSTRLATTAFVTAAAGSGGDPADFVAQSTTVPLAFDIYYNAWTIAGDAVWHAGNLDPGDLGGGLPVASGWSNPSGTGYNKGSFNADDEHPLSNPPTGSEVQALQDRLKDTRAVLRALILDLKTIGILGS